MFKNEKVHVFNDPHDNEKSSKQAVRRDQGFLVGYSFIVGPFVSEAVSKQPFAASIVSVSKEIKKSAKQYLCKHNVTSLIKNTKSRREKQSQPINN